MTQTALTVITRIRWSTLNYLTISCFWFKLIAALLRILLVFLQGFSYSVSNWLASIIFGVTKVFISASCPCKNYLKMLEFMSVDIKRESLVRQMSMVESGSRLTSHVLHTPRCPGSPLEVSGPWWLYRLITTQMRQELAIYSAVFLAVCSVVFWYEWVVCVFSSSAFLSFIRSHTVWV